MTSYPHSKNAKLACMMNRGQSRYAGVILQTPLRIVVIIRLLISHHLHVNQNIVLRVPIRAVWPFRLVLFIRVSAWGKKTDYTLFQHKTKPILWLWAKIACYQNRFGQMIFVTLKFMHQFMGIILIWIMKMMAPTS